MRDDRTSAELLAGTPDHGDLALVLSGGGARGAYQVGVLNHIARHYPELSFPVITGVSAGAVNAAHLAQHHGTLTQAISELRSLWSELSPERVFKVDTPSLMGRALWSGVSLLGGGAKQKASFRGMVDTQPLHDTLAEALGPVRGELTGIDYNLRQGRLRAVAITATSYTTGRSTVWVQGREIEAWRRPQRGAVRTRITLDHVMASTALPLFFPAVRSGAEWFGDGGIRQTAPLSPALHLGASRILAVSNRYNPSMDEAARPKIRDYPPPAQVLGILYDAIFLDVIDQDALRLERINALLERLPEAEREGMRLVRLLVIRPTRDLGKLAGDFEPKLPRAFRFLTRGLGTRRTASPDFLSMVMFQEDYLRRLMEVGEEDAALRADEIAEFLAP
jgi:NTE family protein